MKWKRSKKSSNGEGKQTMGSNGGTKQSHNSTQSSSSVIPHSESKGGVENGFHHQSSTFSSSLENSGHERKKRPSGSTSLSSCNQLVTSDAITTATSRNTSPSSQSSRSSNSSSSSSNGNNRIDVTSPSPNKRSSSSSFRDGGQDQIGIKNVIGSHSSRFTSSSSSSVYGPSKETDGFRLMSPSSCNSQERSEPWNASSTQQHEMCARGGNGGSLSSLLNPITKKQLQDPFYRPFVS